MNIEETFDDLLKYVLKLGELQTSIKYQAWKFACCVAFHTYGQPLHYKGMAAVAPESSKAADIDLEHFLQEGVMINTHCCVCVITHVSDSSKPSPQGLAPVSLSAEIESVVQKKYFKDYLCQGAAEHVKRTFGPEYKYLDINTKIVMVETESVKVPEPVPSQIGYAYGGQYFWPKRPWVDELKVWPHILRRTFF